jgi:uncharacterized protein YegL
MPKLMMIDSDEVNVAAPMMGGSSFQFSAVKIDSLGSTEYTLVDIGVDISGSTSPFKKELLASLKIIIEACKKSPRAENLMVRLVTFDTTVEEVHGFRLLNTINPDDYTLGGGGATHLFEAAYKGIGAIKSYGETLYNQDFGVNAIAFVITDGCDYGSKESAKMVGQVKETILASETLESLLTILIGINVSDKSVAIALKNFETDGKFDQYIESANASPETLAKLASFVSKSISSQSQSLGTGGPSKTLTF